MKTALMADDLTSEDIAQQLKCPYGELGEALGAMMYDSNKQMINTSIDALELVSYQRVMEIGPAGGTHLNYIMSYGKAITYFGLETSKTMVSQAKKNNKKYIGARKALFMNYDGLKIPYVHSFFDRLITVNTIYFWENPIEFMNELFRVLKPQGVGVVTFVDANVMKKLNFVNPLFELYDAHRFKALVAQTGFILKLLKKHTERVKSKDGTMVNREYLVAV